MKTLKRLLILIIAISFTSEIAFVSSASAKIKKSSVSKKLTQKNSAHKKPAKKVTAKKRKPQSVAKKRVQTTPKLTWAEKERRRKALAKRQVEHARALVKAREGANAKKPAPKSFFPDSSKSSKLAADKSTDKSADAAVSIERDMDSEGEYGDVSSTLEEDYSDFSDFDN